MQNMGGALSSAMNEQPAAAPQAGGQGEGVNPQEVEAVQLVAGRAMQALQSSAGELDSAMKADPIRATAELGTTALRKVVQAASSAGKEIPFNIVLMAGIVLIKGMAQIAVEKGYLQEGEIEVFLKEAFQQSVSAYARMDAGDGLIGQDQAGQLQQAAGQMQGGA